MSPVAQLLAGGLAMSALMALLWLVQRRSNDAGIVDVGWTFGTGALAAAGCALADGDPGRRALVAGLALTWSLRLGGYLLWRVLRMPEDGRYTALREAWGERTQPRLFWFFQLQASWAVLFAAPIAAAARRAGPLDALDVVGALIFALAVAGESLADRQLARFRTDPAHAGAVCRAGLWRYSRHPNYFFEWLLWWSYVAIGAGGWTLLGPLAMYVFLVHVTGIPPTEARSLASRGDAYREYQRTTSVFVPWFPR